MMADLEPIRASIALAEKGRDQAARAHPIVDEVCHQDQIIVWGGEVLDHFEEWLSPKDYDESVAMGHAALSAVRHIARGVIEAAPSEAMAALGGFDVLSIDETSAVVSTDLIYPGGSSVAVEVVATGEAVIQISDMGHAHATARDLGAVEAFERRAPVIADERGLSLRDGAFVGEIAVERLPGAVKIVANAALEAAHYARFELEAKAHG